LKKKKTDEYMMKVNQFVDEIDEDLRRENNKKIGKKQTVLFPSWW
jgi:hypothetical protein